MPPLRRHAPPVHPAVRGARGEGENYRTSTAAVSKNRSNNTHKDSAKGQDSAGLHVVTVVTAVKFPVRIQ